MSIIAAIADAQDTPPAKPDDWQMPSGVRLILEQGVDLVLDVGANGGQTGRMLRDCGYQGRIVSFEPLSEAFERLQGASANDPAWEAHKLALGERPATATMHVAANEGQSSSLLEMGQRHREAAPGSGYVGEEEVEVASLDSLAPRLLGPSKRVCLKVDVQGYELAVLRGAAATLPRISLVQSEVSLAPLYEGQPSLEQLTDYLGSFGLEMVASDPGLEDPNSGEVLQVEAVFSNLRIAPAVANRRRSGLRRRLRDRYWTSALSRWLNPRIGRLSYDQHEPEPVTVPRSYPRARAPDPAPAISVVTPSLNQGRWIEQTIRSVLSQGYPKLEYFVQDGGSGDQTPEVLERYRDLLSGCESAPDRNQTHAINRGFERAGGEILAWLNSDDFYLPGTLNWVARYFARHPSVDVIHGNRVFVDEHGRKVGVWVMPKRAADVVDWLNLVAQETMFWRRRAWERIGAALDEEFDMVMDYELLLRLRHSGARIVHVPRFLAAYRFHEQQRSFDMNELEPHIATLQRKYLGHPTTWEQRVEAARPILRRHTLLHNLHRAGQRLPLPRVEVDYSAGSEPLTPAIGSPAAAD
ncbi:MAG: FkbM family methyltransferase [Actinomycetota bacterium]